MNSVFSFVIRTRSLHVCVHQRVWDAMYSCILFKSAHHIQSISTFTRPKVAKKPALLCIMFSSFAFITLLHVFSHHIQSTSTFTRAKVAKKPALLCDMFVSFAFITFLHVFSHDIQSISTFTRVKVAKKPALLCKMFSSFVVIGILHVLSWTKYGQEACFTMYMLYLFQVLQYKWCNVFSFRVWCNVKNSLEIFLLGEGGVP